MTARALPEHIDPFRYAEQGLKLDGFVSLTGMTRLQALLSSVEGKASVRLQFGIDEQKLAFLEGHLETILALQCQRCLEPFNYKIAANFILGIVNNLEEANKLPDYYEPVIAKIGKLAINELIEDELMLNLPIIPKHEHEDCINKEAALLAIDEKQDEGKKNPFRVLESLKHKQ